MGFLSGLDPEQRDFAAYLINQFLPNMDPDLAEIDNVLRFIKKSLISGKATTQSTNVRLVEDTVERNNTRKMLGALYN